MKVIKSQKTFASLMILFTFVTAIIFSPWNILIAKASSNRNSQPNLIGVVIKASGSTITIQVAKLQSNQGGQGFGFRRGPIELTSQTKTINLSKSTSIVKRVFQNGQMVEKKITTKDIQKNHILYIWYADKKKGIISRILINGMYNPYQFSEQIGVVKKVSSNKITVTVATQKPMQPQGSQNRTNQPRQQAPRQGGGFGRFMAIELTNQKKTITITKSTEIVTTTRENGQIKEKKLTIKDIKANNIVEIWFADSKKTTAKRIRVAGTYSSK